MVYLMDILKEFRGFQGNFFILMERARAEEDFNALFGGCPL